MFVLQGTLSQLIYYERPDAAGPKLSDYHITLTEHPEDLKVKNKKEEKTV